ncbi:dexamethasone-induced Ras-related protein 1 isoform X1 [Syngnathus acus]|uniref:dexamethasone-induced Ras-related protein 1 isoform X1 n=1 Tax=Syngnathus acus TaxID=161584 RepID=UPI001885F38E|nr:dexamethasone-induced Ras-related protein 1 isoform X1 [Syngnathus acus]XP_037133457.1 dexamethasone-induced Ras-related protein 1 isoform X1 [Syngnathus acus]XP_037133458.1 dexamethasone-induced Ras-related protein 1 isoform X1 [Syngnathus acus]
MIKKMSPSESDFDIPAKNCYRMVILGSTKVGKTAIVSRFLNGKFDEQYTPTIEDFHRKVYSIKGDVYQLDILDTSGNHPFPAMRRLSILTGDVFILVFSLDNRDSFNEVQRLKRQIYETKSCLKNKMKENLDVPLVICGNKGDREFYRQVQRADIQQLVDGGGGDDDKCAYFEISAKRNENVDQMFQALFALAKLPHEMSPDLHRKVSLQYCHMLHRKSVKNKKMKDVGEAYGMVTPYARRPSVHSDLMYIKEKAVGGGQAKEKERCLIS